MARRARPPLDAKALDELALAYVGRFATTRAKLRSYLARKVRERGWAGGRDPDFEEIAERFASQGFIDDAAYALSKAQALTGRGYGKRRVRQSLHVAGVAEEDGEAAFGHADAEAVAAAVRFAERRRIGPFAAQAARDPKEREKALAAMIRAGHSFGLARALVAMEPGQAVDCERLAEVAGAAS